MKIWMRGLSCLLLVALLAAFPWFMGQRPVGVQKMLGREEARWKGVLSVGIVADFTPGKSTLVDYVTKIATRFEKENPGILVTVQEYPHKALEMAIQGGYAPDILLFGSGIIEDAKETLLPLSGNFDAIREEFLYSASVDDVLYALPIATGAYALIGNSAWIQQFGMTGDMDWDARLIALGGEKNNSVQCAKAENLLPAAGLIAATGGAVLRQSQSVPTTLPNVSRAMGWPEFALEQKYAMYLGTQYEVARMALLQSNGKTFAWEVVDAQDAYTDQVLYGGIVNSRCTGRQEDARLAAEAAGELLSFFTSGQTLEDLTKLQLFSTGYERLYEGVRGMSTVEDSLFSGQLIIPNAFGYKKNVQTYGGSMDGVAQYLAQMGYAP